MHWQLYKQDTKLANELAGELKISPITAQVLINRGINSVEEVERFLRPSLQHLHDPFLMKDMDKGVERIISAIKAGERITIYGDYDADGVCATALLLKFFGMIGAAADYHIPHRIKDGYGLNTETVKRLKERGTNLIITVDNGINAHEQVDTARKLGIDVIVTDHHEPPSRLPKACAVINPKRRDCKFPFKELAGVGIAFNLVIALRQKMREMGLFKEEPRLRPLLEIVALGTVADVAPLTGENRIFVKFGLEELKKSTSRGISALKIISGLEVHNINTTSIAFRLAPRINAAGRIDDQDLGVELLTTEDPEEATAIAQKLHETNARRQSIEGMILKEAEEMIKASRQLDGCLGMTLSREGWHPGVIGIVATRLAEAYKKPTVVIGIDGEYGRGSARSIGSYNIIHALGECANLLERFGGHRHAAGLTIASKNIQLFEKRFNEIVSSSLKEEDRLDYINVDAELDTDLITEELIGELEMLQPFGEGNPEPVFCTRGLKVSTSRIVKEKHLKLKFSDNLITLDAIGFGMAGRNVIEEDILDVAFIPQIDTWQGAGAVQLKLRDLKESA